jgi:hypothetical protein
MGHIRPFIEGDIPRVARLHRKVFRTSELADALGLDSYHAYFTRVFLENPLRDNTLPSLVYEEDDERIVGFLGVVPRRMTMNGHKYQAAIGSQFVVDPAAGVGLVAIRLARAFFEGPQDLSISDEASDIARKLWEGLGGTTSLLRSLHWTRPLRPAQLVVTMLRRRRRLAPLAIAAAPVARLIDGLSIRIPHSHFHQRKPATSSAETLTEEAVLSYVPVDRGLHVEYDGPTLHWLLERARQRRAGGSLHAAMVRNQDRIIGWYLYHLDRDRIANVLQIAAEPPAVREVLDQLFYQSSGHGAIAATGRMEPRYLQALSDKYCLFHRRGPWVLLNTKRVDLLRSFEAEDTLFSRLDGEWCLGY